MYPVLEAFSPNDREPNSLLPWEELLFCEKAEGCLAASEVAAASGGLSGATYLSQQVPVPPALQHEQQSQHDPSPSPPQPSQLQPSQPQPSQLQSQSQLPQSQLPQSQDPQSNPSHIFSDGLKQYNVKFNSTWSSARRNCVLMWSPVFLVRISSHGSVIVLKAGKPGPGGSQSHFDDPRVCQSLRQIFLSIDDRSACHQGDATCRASTHTILPSSSPYEQTPFNAFWFRAERVASKKVEL